MTQFKIHTFAKLSTRNSKFKIRGFTLTELLIAIAVFATTGTIILSILFVTLRTSSKSEKLVILKQNGNTAVSQIVKHIRYAKSLDSPASCPVSPGPALTSITITSVLDNGKTTFSCEVGPPATIASNSASLVDTNSVVVTQCSFTCSQPTLNDPPTINFSITLDAKSTNNLVETTGSIPFQTSVIMRNFNK